MSKQGSKGGLRVIQLVCGRARIGSQVSLVLSPAPHCSPNTDKCPSVWNSFLHIDVAAWAPGREQGWEVTKRVCLGAVHSVLSLCRQPLALGLPQPQSVRGGDGWVCEFAHPDAVLLSEVRVPEEIQPDPLAPCPRLVLPICGLWVSPGGKSCLSCLLLPLSHHLSFLSLF